jgi:hypothetical protein
VRDQGVSGLGSAADGLPIPNPWSLIPVLLQELGHFLLHLIGLR